MDVLLPGLHLGRKQKASTGGNGTLRSAPALVGDDCRSPSPTSPQGASLKNPPVLNAVTQSALHSSWNSQLAVATLRLFEVMPSGPMAFRPHGFNWEMVTEILRTWPKPQGTPSTTRADSAIISCEPYATCLPRRLQSEKQGFHLLSG